jgi:hypothetical protein
MASEEAQCPEPSSPERDDRNNEQGSARRRMFRFNPVRDILLLREVIGQRPFAAGYGQAGRVWESITRNLNTGGMPVTLSTVQGRCALLKRAFRKQQMEQLRRSGTEEECSEREQLLQDLIEMEAAAASDDSARRQEGAALERQREDQGAQLRLAATMGRRASQGDSESQESQPSGSGPLPKRRRSDMAEDFLRIKEDTLRMEIEDRRRARDEARDEARLQREANMAIRDRELALREQELAVRKLQLEVRR